ncbi:MAG: DUF4623 domain-containing protein [Bacteroidota bacterium]|jgi:hypothetical protein
MNLINNLKYCVIITSVMAMFFVACSEDYPENVESPYEVVLESIKIVNAGPDGNMIVEGTVDEDKKTVTFPRIDPETDLSNIRFEAQLSEGATLDKEYYKFPFSEGESEKTIVVKVVNGPRFREYFVTLRLLVPVYGADFTKPQIFDYTNNEMGMPIYPTFTSQLTRGSGFDGQHVLIVTRHAWGSHLLKVEDVKNNVDFNDESKRIALNLTGVSGGTFPVNCGAIVHGHIYIANLSGGKTSPFRIYHWTDPTLPPQKIADINIGVIEGAGVRHGDNMSVNLDENGNGYMYFGDNAATTILRLQVTNFTTISNPTVLPHSKKSVTFCMSFNRVDNTDDYIFTGYEAPIMVADENAAIKYELGANAVPLRGSDARVISFNKERYLIMTTAARSGSDATVFYVFDITKGDNTIDALNIFNEQADKSPVFQYSLLGPTNAAPSTQTGWHVIKDNEGNDESLMLYTASTDAGFVLFEFPKKQLED